MGWERKNKLRFLNQKKSKPLKIDDNSLLKYTTPPLKRLLASLHSVCRSRVRTVQNERKMSEVIINDGNREEMSLTSR